nr:retrovirus-related Pol polyprotein from transposon TNT 1-94 [Tanacetum cinerariifolium]
MALTFADTHNMITYLTKSDASEGFDQIIDFLNASSIKYTLTANDVVRLQALIDRKKVIITEATIREALRLDDAESIDCLPNEEIFTELSRMGYEKPLTKLTFYKAFFLEQWNLVRNVDSSSKFYMYPRFLQLMIRAQVGDLSSHTTKYSSPALTQKVFTNMRRAGKEFSKVETPLFKGILVPQQADADVDDVVNDDVVIDDVFAVDAEPTPPSPPPTTTPPPPQDLPSTSQIVPTLPPLPITEPSSPPQQQQPLQPTTVSMDLLQSLLETCTALTRRVENLKQDKVLVVKPHNKTPYELFRGRTPALSFMRQFRCHVTIFNTLNHLGKLDGKYDDGFFIGYSLNSKAFRGNPQKEDQGYVDSGCSRHMTGNMSYLSYFKEFDEGYVTFGGGTKGGKITGKGTLKIVSIAEYEDKKVFLETWECKQPRNQDSMSRNQDRSRRTVNMEETNSNAMVAIDGADFDWSYMADDEVPTNITLMAFLDFEEFQQPEVEGYGPKTSNSVSENISNEVKKSLDVLLVKELVSDDKLEKKINFPTVTKKEFVRSKQREKPFR